MGAFIARQPNGLLCRFSSIVDTITHYNMTDEDYIEYCAEIAKENARFDLERRVKPFHLVTDYFVPNNCSVEEFNSYLREMGSDKQLDPADYE